MAPARRAVVRNTLANGRVPHGNAFRRFLMEMANGAPATHHCGAFGNVANLTVEGVLSCAAPAACGLGSGSGFAIPVSVRTMERSTM
jgi:hypothetical protein